ncbi:MAG: hypothetical protein NTX49_10220 [Chlamydiae bacterium]|nr:hypothetical protein [Chlamydiota bacterium]
MTTSQIPLFKPPSSVKLLEESSVRPLLESRIAISYRALGGVKSVETSIGEVYRRCQKALAAEFGSPLLVIKGSSVARLFSGEPAEDVDMHYVADLTHLPESVRIKRGYDLKWAVLGGMVQLITEKLPVEETRTLIGKEDILFTEKPYMLSTKTAAPFNVHGISFARSPVELTLFSITKTVMKSERGFDFNSGALELYLDPEGRNFLGCYLPDIDATLSEVARRDLTCIAPEEILRKGLARYMAKLAISGYYDKDPALFETLLLTEIQKGKGSNEEALVKSVLEMIAAHFREKNSSPRALYLFLWLMKGDTPLIKLLSKQAKEALLLELAGETAPQIQTLLKLIASNKKAESSWFLLMQAKSLRKVIQRGEECLQIELPLKTIFLGSQPVEHVFITVPLQGLHMLAELSSAEGFFSLQNTESVIEVKGDDTKASMQALLQETLSRPSLLPAFLTAMQKFSLKPGGDFPLKLLAWFEALPEEERRKIPLFTVKNFLESLACDSSLRPSTALSLIRLVNIHQRSSLDSIVPRQTLTSIVFQLLKGDKFESLEEEDKEIIKAYGKELCLDFLKNRKESLKAIEVECKKIAGILYILYQKGSVDISPALGGAAACLEIEAFPQTFKFLSAIVANEADLNHPVLLGFLLRIARIHPLEFAKFTIEQAPVMKRKMSSFNSVVDSLFYQIDGDRGSSELCNLFVQLLDKMGSEDLKTIYKNEVFQNAILGNRGYEALFNKMKEVWGISSLDFIPMDQLGASSIIFLGKQEDFKRKFEEDPLFTKSIGLQALSVGLEDLAINASLHLARINPEESLEVLQAYLKGKELSKKSLLQSLKILGKILERAPGLASKEPFQSVILQRLDGLAVLVSSTAFTSFMKIDEESLECIRHFHSLVVIETLEHPCWKLLWHYIREKQLPVQNWINSKEIGSQLSRINPKGNIVALLQTFTLDAPFLIEFIRGMIHVPPSEIDKYKSLLFFAFKMGNNSLLINLPKIDGNTHAPAQFLFELLNSFYTAREVAPGDLVAFDIALLGLKFSSLFGDRSLREKTMVTIQSLMENSGPVLRGFIKNSVHPKSILLSCLDRALEEKKLEELYALVQVYNTWRLDEDLGEKIIYGKTEIITARCLAFQKYLGELFKDPLHNERITARSPECEVLKFYAIYLEELIIAQTIYESSSTIRAELAIKGQNFPVNQELLYKYFSDLIDFLTRKKLLGATSVSLQILNTIGLQKDRERFSLFSNKYLLMTTELFSALSKKPMDKESAAPFFPLFVGLSVLQNQAEKRGEVLFDQALMLRFLKIARTTLPEITSNRDQYLLSTYQLPMLEGTLNRENTEVYLHDWASSIISRKETVSFEELNLFALYTFRLDVRVYDSPDMLPFQPRFKDKLILNQKFFNSSYVIKNYTDVIDIALSRFSHKLFDSSIVPDEFTVFNLFPFYCDYLLQGIVNQRDISAKENLQVSLILTVAKCLRLPQITTLSNPAMKCLLNSLIGKKAKDLFELNKFSKAKLPLATQLGIFHLLVQQLLRFSHIDLRTENAYFIILKHTYENGIAYRNKAFSKDQIAEIERILTAPAEIADIIKEAVKEEASTDNCVVT